MMSLRVIRKDKEILVFPVLSGLLTMLILASFVGEAFLTGMFDTASRARSRGRSSRSSSRSTS